MGPLLLQLSPAVVFGVLYWRRARTLREGGRPVPGWRVACWYAGLVLIVGTLVSPLATLADDRFSAHMAVSYGVIVAFITAFFAVPTIFVHAGPTEQRRTRALDWEKFLKQGVATATGHCGGTEAAVLVLLLPFLIFCFGIVVAVSAAFIT